MLTQRQEVGIENCSMCGREIKVNYLEQQSHEDSSTQYVCGRPECTEAYNRYKKEILARK